MERLIYKVKDIDASFLVEKVTRKELLLCLDEFIENLKYDWFSSDDVFMITYSDGYEEYISQQNYDGHKIKRVNIESFINSNDSTYMVFGNYKINEYGVITPAKETTVDKNIVYIGRE